MNKLLIAGAVIVAAIGLAIFAASQRTEYSTDYATKPLKYSSVRYDALDISTRYEGSRYKRAVPYDLRETPHEPGTDLAERIQLEGFPSPGYYTFSFSTNTPGCSAGDGKYSLLETNSRAVLPEEVGFGTESFASRRFPDCVRMTITKDGVSESHDFDFSQFE
jgi:hypothetical protein